MFILFRSIIFYRKSYTAKLYLIHDENILTRDRLCRSLGSIFYRKKKENKVLFLFLIKNPLCRFTRFACESTYAFFIENRIQQSCIYSAPGWGGGNTKGGTSRRNNPSNNCERKRKGLCGGGAGRAGSTRTLSYNHG